MHPSPTARYDEMAKFTVSITTDNDAFQDGNLREELARILFAIGNTVAISEEDWGYHKNIRDINGNTVGTFALKEDDGSPGIIS